MDINYKETTSADFFYTLNQRVNNFFQSKNLSPKTNAFGVFKAVLFSLVYLGLYAGVIFAAGNNALLLFCFALMGFIQICIVLNLGHEGVHSSFSNSKIVNSIFAYTFDLIGSSGYLWRMRHVYSHHPHPMIPEHDVDIQQTGLLTFMPMKEPKSFFKHQHIYVPFLYCFYTLNAIFKRDWEDFFSNKIGTKVVKHSPAAIFSFILSKILYYTYSLVLPLMLSGCYWPIVLLGFVLMHIMASLSAAVALFPAHLYEDSIFPEPNEKGEMNTDWAQHQMSVTMDFGTNKKAVAFFFGGINYHIVHHLFPTVAHVHFPEIQKILEATAKEFNVEYKHKPSLRKALYSHWQLLKKNGVAHMSEIY